MAAKKVASRVRKQQKKNKTVNVIVKKPKNKAEKKIAAQNSVKNSKNKCFTKKVEEKVPLKTASKVKKVGSAIKNASQVNVESIKNIKKDSNNSEFICLKVTANKNKSAKNTATKPDNEIIALKRKMNREIFQRCLERKLFSVIPEREEMGSDLEGI
jgi:hypothetical protein